MPEVLLNTKNRPMTELEVMQKIEKLIPGLTDKGLVYIKYAIDERLAQQKLAL